MRPKNFQEVVGQELVTNALKHSISKKNFHHAYLFTGGRGVGKTTIARLIAKAINCQKITSGEPCKKCNYCRDIDLGKFIDVLEIDAASNRGVEEIQQILEQVQFLPALGTKKIMIIDEVHMLSNHAFNAMLKTLEEPPDHIMFILATTEPQKIPQTVISRCLKFTLGNISPKLIEKYLENTFKELSIPFEQSAINSISKAAQGSLRDALSISDQAISCGEGSITKKIVDEMLGFVPNKLIDELVETISNNDPNEALKLTTTITKSGVPADLILERLSIFFHDLSVKKATGVDSENFDFINTNSNNLTINLSECNIFYQIIVLGRRDLTLAPNDSVGLEMTILRLFFFLPIPVDSISSEKYLSNTEENKKLETKSISLNKNEFTKNENIKNLNNSNWPKIAKNFTCSGLLKQFFNQSEFISMTFKKNFFLIEFKVKLEVLTDNELVEKARVFMINKFNEELKIKVVLCQEINSSVASNEKKQLNDEKLQAEEFLKKSQVINKILIEFDAEVVPNSIGLIN